MLPLPSLPGHPQHSERLCSSRTVWKTARSRKSRLPARSGCWRAISRRMLGYVTSKNTGLVPVRIAWCKVSFASGVEVAWIGQVVSGQFP